VSYDPDADWSPASWFSAYTSSLHDEYRTHWGLNKPVEETASTGDEEELNRHLSELAEPLAMSLHTLKADEALIEKIRAIVPYFGVTADIGDDVAIKIAEVLQSNRIVRDAIRINLAFQVADSLLPSAEDRAPRLLALLSTRQLSLRAAAYLDRATRLYLWGFDPEAVVMCASMLEAAYGDRFSEIDMFRLQITKKTREYGHHDYEQAAIASGVFTREETQLARRLRGARNDTIHNAPNTAMNAETALKTTATLLDRLYPR